MFGAVVNGCQRSAVKHDLRAKLVKAGFYVPRPVHFPFREISAIDFMTSTGQQVVKRFAQLAFVTRNEDSQGCFPLPRICQRIIIPPIVALLEPFGILNSVIIEVLYWYLEHHRGYSGASQG
jgi:hypothetical protein